MSARNGKPRFDYEIHIGASPEQVWHALANGDMTRAYLFGTRFEGKLDKGESYAYLADNAFKAVDGEILEVTPNRRLVMSWRAHWDTAVEQDAASRVTYELEPTGPRTSKLRITHDQFDGETATYTGSVASWPLVLSALKTLLETGNPLPTT